MAEDREARLSLLDERLELLRAGRPLAECLEGLEPADRAEIEPLLATARLLAGARPALPPAAAAAHQRLLLTRAATLRAARSTLAIHPWWRLGRAFGVLAAVFLLLVGALVASAESLPESPLYAVKRVGELLQQTFALDAAARARVNVFLAHRRLAEAEALLRRDGSVPEELLLEIRTRTEAASALARQLDGPEAHAVLAEVSGVLAREQALLRAVVEAADPTGHARLALLIAAARADQQTVESALIDALAPPRPTRAPRQATATPEPTPTAPSGAAGAPAPIQRTRASLPSDPADAEPDEAQDSAAAADGPTEPTSTPAATGAGPEARPADDQKDERDARPTDVPRRERSGRSATATPTPDQDDERNRDDEKDRDRSGSHKTAAATPTPTPRPTEPSKSGRQGSTPTAEPDDRGDSPTKTSEPDD